MPKPLQERARLIEAATTSTPGNRLMQLISPGWGSSGFYSAEVLEHAVADQLFPAGLHMYADHDPDAAATGRSVKDLVSVTVTEGQIATDEQVAAGADVGAVVAEIRVAAPYRDLIDDIGEQIGVSIWGDATDITIGEAEGRRGKIVEGLAHIASVDWVTHAGRGGKVLSLLESARATQRATRRGLAEATVNDTRDGLHTALRDAYADDDVWTYVRDFDETTVWFEIEGNADLNGIYAQSYTQDDNGPVALTGDRTEVRVVTTYVPATRPDGKKKTEESEEDTMPKIQIEEAEHVALVEKAGRVDALTNENATLKENAAQRDRTDRATELVIERAKAGGITFDPLQTRGLLVNLPVAESGDLDETAFSAAVDTEVARVKEAQAAGSDGSGDGGVRGFGGSPGTGVTEAAAARTTNPWGRSLNEQKGA